MILLFLLTWIILLTPNPCDKCTTTILVLDTRCFVNWKDKQRKKIHDYRKSKKMTVLSCEPLAGVAESSVHARKTDSVTSLVAADRRLDEYLIPDYSCATTAVRAPEVIFGDGTLRGVTGSTDAHARWRVRSSRPTAVFLVWVTAAANYCPRHKQNNSQTASYS